MEKEIKEILNSYLSVLMKNKIIYEKKDIIDKFNKYFNTPLTDECNNTNCIVVEDKEKLEEITILKAVKGFY